MLNRLNDLKTHSDYVYFVSVLIKSFIRRGRLDLLKIIFKKRENSLLFKKNNLNTKDILDVLKIAYAVG